MPYGKTIAEMLAIDGFKTLESFAAADPQGWAAMSNSVVGHPFKLNGKQLTSDHRLSTTFQPKSSTVLPRETLFWPLTQNTLSAVSGAGL